MEDERRKKMSERENDQLVEKSVDAEELDKRVEKKIE